MIRTVQWADGKVRIIDQTRLPADEVYLEIDDYRELARAIREMRIRGAPALGVAAAYGVALGAFQVQAATKEQFLAGLREVISTIAATRPTARNLFWALERMERVAEQAPDVRTARARLLSEALLVEREDEETNRAIGRHGAALMHDGFHVLTHCNAGALATAAYGTALGVIRAAVEEGKRLHVYIDETRPLLQGSRLTAWELITDGIPATLLTDNMAGHFLQRRQIDCVVVGADRIAANGDVANKIGTYTVAVLAHENGIPFYVAAPTSTIDLSMATGDEIPIEERDPAEVTHLGGKQVAPEGIAAANPAFDVTPHRYVTAIVTEKGVLRPPYGPVLARALSNRREGD